MEIDQSLKDRLKAAIDDKFEGDLLLASRKIQVPDYVIATLLEPENSFTIKKDVEKYENFLAEYDKEKERGR